MVLESYTGCFPLGYHFDYKTTTFEASLVYIKVKLYEHFIKKQAQNSELIDLK